MYLITSSLCPQGGLESGGRGRHESEFNSRENQKRRKTRGSAEVGTASLLVPKWALDLGSVSPDFESF